MTINICGKILIDSILTSMVKGVVSGAAWKVDTQKALDIQAKGVLPVILDKLRPKLPAGVTPCHHSLTLRSNKNVN